MIKYNINYKYIYSRIDHLPSLNYKLQSFFITFFNYWLLKNIGVGTLYCCITLYQITGEVIKDVKLKLVL